MKQSTKKIVVILAVIALLCLMVYNFFTGNYNQMVSLDQGVKSQWGQVENVYQRRFDLIPNLVATVKGYAAHESSVLTEVTEARSRAGGVMNISDEVLNDPEAFARFQRAQGEISGALQRLLMVTENYPDLKANQNFIALQDQLEGTENRISVERKRFNERVETYNIFIKQFPRSFIANLSGFREKPYFKADEAAQSAPQVSFE